MLDSETLIDEKDRVKNKENTRTITLNIQKGNSMDTSSFNWPLFQLIIDCFLIVLIFFLLFVLFREHKQRLLLKKWILRQLRLNSMPTQSGEQDIERYPSSADEAVERLRREIELAQRVLNAVETGPTEEKEPSLEPATPQPSTPAAQPSAPSPSREEEPAPEKPDAVEEAIRYLLKKGMRPLEISKQLHIPIEDVERAYGSGITERERF